MAPLRLSVSDGSTGKEQADTSLSAGGKVLPGLSAEQGASRLSSRRLCRGSTLEAGGWRLEQLAALRGIVWPSAWVLRAEALRCMVREGAGGRELTLLFACCDLGEFTVLLARCDLGEFTRSMVGSAGTCQPAARRSQACRRARVPRARRRGAPQRACGYASAPQSVRSSAGNPHPPVIPPDPRRDEKCSVPPSRAVVHHGTRDHTRSCSWASLWTQRLSRRG